MCERSVPSRRGSGRGGPRPSVPPRVRAASRFLRPTVGGERRVLSEDDGPYNCAALLRSMRPWRSAQIHRRTPTRDSIPATMIFGPAMHGGTPPRVAWSAGDVSGVHQGLRRFPPAGLLDTTPRTSTPQCSAGWLCYLHFTPTYSLWQNHVEHWFGLLGEKALNRGTQWNVRELVDQFRGFTEGHIEAIKRVDRHIRKEYRHPPKNLVGRHLRFH